MQSKNKFNPDNVRIYVDGELLSTNLETRQAIEYKGEPREFRTEFTGTFDTNNESIQKVFKKLAEAVTETMKQFADLYKDLIKGIEKNLEIELVKEQQLAKQNKMTKSKLRYLNQMYKCKNLVKYGNQYKRTARNNLRSD